MYIIQISVDVSIVVCIQFVLLEMFRLYLF